MLPRTRVGRPVAGIELDQRLGQRLGPCDLGLWGPAARRGRGRPLGLAGPACYEEY